MKVFLLGFMGAGKTTQGKRLARMLAYGFTDLDEVIIQNEEMGISELFQEKGEAYFREKESLYLKGIADQDNQVISVGGGTPCFHENMDWMNNNGITVYIELDEETLLGRLMNSKLDRPLIQGKSREEALAFIRESLDKRQSFYEKARVIVPGKNLSTKLLLEKLSPLIEAAQ